MADKPDQLDPSDLDYERDVRDQVRMVNAIRGHWSAHLVRKYQLGPQDQITDDGTIQRVTTPHAVEPRRSEEARTLKRAVGAVAGTSD